MASRDAPELTELGLAGCRETERVRAAVARLRVTLDPTFLLQLVPALIYRLLPRWLAVTGIVIAVVGELSALSLIGPSALFLSPLTRVPAFVWLIAAGLRLPQRAPARAQST